MSYKHIFRFYGWRDDVGKWQIHPAELKHLAVVLKKKSNEVVELCDGRGQVARIRIIQCHPRHPRYPHHCEFEIISEQAYPPPHPMLKVVVMADITAELADLLPALTELGLNVLSWPVSSQQHWHDKQSRFERIARAAIKQSKSPYFVKLCPVSSLEQCRSSTARYSVQVDLSSERSLAQLLLQQPLPRDGGEICLYLGGRSGFSPAAQHVLAAVDDLVVAHLGAYVLRLPTAIQAAVAVSRQLLGS